MVAWTGHLLTYFIIYFLLSVVEEAVVFMIGGDHLLAIPVLPVIPPVHHLLGVVSTTLLREDIQGWMPSFVKHPLSAVAIHLFSQLELFSTCFVC